MVNGDVLPGDSDGVASAEDLGVEEEIVEAAERQQQEQKASQEEEEVVSEEEKERGVSVSPGDGSTEAGYFEGGEQIATEEDIQEGLEEGRTTQEIREQGLRETDQPQELLEAQAETGDVQARELVELQESLERVEQGGVTPREAALVGGNFERTATLTASDLGVSERVQAAAGAEGVSPVEEEEVDSFRDLGIGEETEDVVTGAQREIETSEEIESVKTRGSEAVERLEGKKERRISEIDNRIENVVDGEQNVVLDDGTVLSGREAADYLRGLREQIITSYDESIENVEEQVESFVEEGEADIESFESEFRRGMENLPFKGVTTEKAFESLTPVERAAASAEASIGGAPAEVVAGIFRGGPEEGAEEVVERFGELRTETLSEDVSGSFFNNLRSGVALESAGRAGVLLGAGAAAGAAGEALVGAAGTAGGLIASATGITSAAKGAAVGQAVGLGLDIGTGLATAGPFVEESVEQASGVDIGGGLQALSPFGGVDLEVAGERFSPEPTSEREVEIGTERLTRAGFMGVSGVGGAAQFSGLSDPANIASGLQSLSEFTGATDVSLLGRLSEATGRTFSDEIASVRSFQEGTRAIGTDEFAFQRRGLSRARSADDFGGEGIGVTRGGVPSDFSFIRRSPVTSVVETGDDSVVAGVDPFRSAEVETEGGRTMRFVTSSDLVGRGGNSVEGIAEVDVLKTGEGLTVRDPGDFDVSRQVVDFEVEGTDTFTRELDGFRVVSDENVVFRPSVGRSEVVGRVGDTEFESTGRFRSERAEFVDEGEFVERRATQAVSETDVGRGQVESETFISSRAEDVEGVEGFFEPDEVDTAVFDTEDGTGLRVTRLEDIAEDLRSTAEDIWGRVDKADAQVGGEETVSGLDDLDEGRTVSGDTGVDVGGGQRQRISFDVTDYDAAGVTDTDVLFTEDIYSAVAEEAVRQYVSRNLDVETVEGISPFFGEPVDTGVQPDVGLRGQVEGFEPGVEPVFDTGVRTEDVVTVGRSDTGVGRVAGVSGTGMVSDVSGVGREDVLGTRFGTAGNGRTGLQPFPDLGQVAVQGFGGFGFPGFVPQVSPGAGGRGGLGIPDLDVDVEGAGTGFAGFEEQDVDVTGGGVAGLGVITASEAEFLPGVREATLPESPEDEGTVFGVIPVELRDRDDEEEDGFLGFGGKIF